MHVKSDLLETSINSSLTTPPPCPSYHTYNNPIVIFPLFQFLLHKKLREKHIYKYVYTYAHIGMGAMTGWPPGTWWWCLNGLGSHTVIMYTDTYKWRSPKKTLYTGYS